MKQEIKKGYEEWAEKCENTAKDFRMISETVELERMTEKEIKELYSNLQLKKFLGNTIKAYESIVNQLGEEIRGGNGLKRQAIKMGLQVGSKVIVYKMVHRNQNTKEYKREYVGVVAALYEHIFVIQNEKGATESFQYKQFIATKEVRLWQKSKSGNLSQSKKKFLQNNIVN